MTKHRVVLLLRGEIKKVKLPLEEIMAMVLFACKCQRPEYFKLGTKVSDVTTANVVFAFDVLYRILLFVLCLCIVF